ncbi:hypothetical protein JAAARDRAFT_208499 [Jaapia argillacea MUCL 33604]|uniref:WW domain-containing protein n=1 Tax=Jaapia argillacea MUCL 33604 TaxID=933084 RepID=A0A067PZD5_9AGAM|nr:hypothetical protein JAAARDRAFT_208499 [Jaapia argillacea MUCL 33604]
MDRHYPPEYDDEVPELPGGRFRKWLPVRSLDDLSVVTGTDSTVSNLTGVGRTLDGFLSRVGGWADRSMSKVAQRIILTPDRLLLRILRTISEAFCTRCSDPLRKLVDECLRRPGEPPDLTSLIPQLGAHLLACSNCGLCRYLHFMYHADHDKSVVEDCKRLAGYLRQTAIRPSNRTAALNYTSVLLCFRPDLKSIFVSLRCTEALQTFIKDNPLFIRDDPRINSAVTAARQALSILNSSSAISRDNIFDHMGDLLRVSSSIESRRKNITAQSTTDEQSRLTENILRSLKVFDDAISTLLHLNHSLANDEASASETTTVLPGSRYPLLHQAYTLGALPPDVEICFRHDAHIFFHDVSTSSTSPYDPRVQSEIWAAYDADHLPSGWGISPSTDKGHPLFFNHIHYFQTRNDPRIRPVSLESSTLPAGWKFQIEASHLLHFVDNTTQSRTRVDPRRYPEIFNMTPLPIGWEVHLSPQEKSYFFDPKTRVRTFEDPRIHPELLHIQPLPAGWEMLLSPRDALVFFDSKTRVSTFEDPRTHPELLHLQPLPAGWEMLFSPRDALVFFDSKTRVSSFEDPRTHPELLDMQPLPVGWEMRFSDNDSLYFFNSKTQVGTFNDPRLYHDMLSFVTGTSSTISNFLPGIERTLDNLLSRVGGWVERSLSKVVQRSTLTPDRLLLRILRTVSEAFCARCSGPLRRLVDEYLNHPTKPLILTSLIPHLGAHLLACSNCGLCRYLHFMYRVEDDTSVVEDCEKLVGYLRRIAVHPSTWTAALYYISLLLCFRPDFKSIFVGLQCDETLQSFIDDRRLFGIDDPSIDSAGTAAWQVASILTSYTIIARGNVFYDIIGDLLRISFNIESRRNNITAQLTTGEQSQFTEDILSSLKVIDGAISTLLHQNHSLPNNEPPASETTTVLPPSRYPLLHQAYTLGALPPNLEMCFRHTAHIVFLDPSTGSTSLYSSPILSEIWEAYDAGHLPIGWGISPSTDEGDPLFFNHIHYFQTKNDPRICSISLESSTLPVGWRFQIEASHLLQFVDNTTQSRTRVDPRRYPEIFKMPPLPSGWEVHLSPQEKPYFFDSKTQVHTFEDPRRAHPELLNVQTLPPGWGMRISDNDMLYFFDWKTRIATFEDPRIHPPPLDTEPLPAAWEMRISAKCTPYFIDPKTQFSTFKDPRAHPDVLDPEPLPARWRMRVSPDDTLYFINLATGVSTFQDPRVGPEVPTK